jgi:hypothetical protein
MQTWLEEDVIEQLCIAEILKDSQTVSGRRLAMIIVDNSVEYMLKAYGDTVLVPSKISKSKWEEKKQSFKTMLDFVSANSKLTEKPDDIFHYHDKLRNPLYHEAAPLSVEPKKIEEYIGKSRIIMRDLFGVHLSQRDWDNRIKKTLAALGGKAKPRLVEFFKTDDNLARTQTDVKLRDTDAILLMIYGFALITGREPSDIGELGKCLNYSGHPIKQDRIRVNVAHLRAAKKVNKDELTLTGKARDTIKSKYIVPA